jgi:hypothetical protein
MKDVIKSIWLGLRLSGVLVPMLFTVTMVALLALGIRVAYALEERSCNMIEKNGGPATEWKGAFNGGCYIRINDQWIPRDNWRGEYQR